MPRLITSIDHRDELITNCCDPIPSYVAEAGFEDLEVEMA
jgi:hypothetical protein